MTRQRLPRGFKRTPAGKVIRLGSSNQQARGYCKRCGLVMDDNEPFSTSPEWFHKVTGRCPNDGKSFVPKYVRDLSSGHVAHMATDKMRQAGVVRFRRKSHR